MVAEPVTAQPAEYELLRTRIHWGILLIPLYLAIPVAIGIGMPVLAARQFLLRATGQAPSVFIWGPAVLALVPVAFLSFAALTALFDTEYVLTSRRLRFRTGWFMRASGELLLQDIEAILLIEPFAGQILGYGVVVVSGRGGTRIPLRFVPSASRFHASLEEAREAARSGQPPPRPPAPAVRKPPSPVPSAEGPDAARKTALPQREATPRAPSFGSFEKAWEELNRPLPNDPPDDSRYRPKS